MFEETDSNNRKNNPHHWVHLDGLEKFLFFISVPFGLGGFIGLLFFYDELDKTIQIKTSEIHVLSKIVEAGTVDSKSVPSLLCCVRFDS